MRPYGVTERLFTVLRHILALGVVHHRAEAAERDVGSDGPVVYDAESKDVSEDGE